MPTYSTIKSSIGTVVSSNHKDKVRKSIDFRVGFVSRARHRGSMALLMSSVHCYETSSVLPIFKKNGYSTKFVQQCFAPFPTKNGNNQWRQTEVPVAVLDYMEPGWNERAVTPSEIKGYARHMKHESNSYATRAVNHVAVNTLTFIGYTIQSFLISINLPDTAKKSHPLFKDIMNKIQQGSTYQLTYAMSNQQEEDDRDEFIQYHLTYLDNHDIDLCSDLASQHEKIILYFVHLLRYQNEVDLGNGRQPKLFYPVPMNSITRSSITVDGEILFYILKDAGVPDLPKTCPQETNNNGVAKNMTAPFFVKHNYYQGMFNKYIQNEQHETARRQFNYSDGLSTNGVKASLKYEIDDTLPCGPPQPRPRPFRYLESKSCYHQN